MSGFLLGFPMGMLFTIALLVAGVWLLVRHAGKPAIAHFLQSMAFVMAGKRDNPQPAPEAAPDPPPPAAETNGTPGPPRGRNRL